MSSRSRILHFDDPEAYAGSIHNIHARVTPSETGAYRARLVLVQLPKIHLAMSEENLARHFTLDATPERIFFRIKHADEVPNLRNGNLVESGTVAIGRRGAKVDDRTHGKSAWRSLSITSMNLAFHAEKLRRRSLFSIFNKFDIFRPSPRAFQRLAALQQDVFRLAADTPHVLEHPIVARLLDEQLLDALLDILVSEPADRESLAQRRHHAIMRKVMPFIEANVARPLTLTELCEVGGCSAKLLEMVFVQAYGHTPNRHLRLRRLWGARRSLLVAQCANATVSQIACAWGFWELGRFASAYRHLFGESPSQTLRRHAA